MGKTRSAGPHLVRLQKAGDALTLAIATNYDPKKPLEFDITRTLPSLKAAGPFLTKRNSQVFISGGRIEAIRYSVDGKPVAVDAPPAPLEAPKLVQLAQAMPDWLKVDERTTADEQGLLPGKDGMVRTAVAGYVDRDFAFDLVFKFKPERGTAIIGIGPNKKSGGWIDDSICMTLAGPNMRATPQMRVHRLHTNVGEALTEGPHMLRIEKRGNALTLALMPDYDGTFVPTLTRTVPDVSGIAPFLTRANSFLFFQGQASFISAGLTVRGEVPGAKPATPATGGTTGTSKPPAGGSQTPPTTATPTPPNTGGTAPVTPPTAGGTQTTPPEAGGTTAGNTGGPAAGAATSIASDAHLLKLNSDPLPRFLDADAAAEVPMSAEGMYIRDKWLRTKRADLASKDFTFDVLFSMGRDENGPLTVGIGENGREGGWLLNSVGVRLHGRARDGVVSLAQHRKMDAEIGKMRGEGPYMVRLVKQGKTLTMAVCSNYKGTFEADFSRTLPDLGVVAPFLTERNGYLFMDNSATIHAVRLVVAGEPIETRDVPLGLPRFAVEGQAMKLELVKSPVAGVSLLEGPKGATLSPGGAFAWTPSAAQVGRNVVSVAIDTGKEKLVSHALVDIVPAAEASRLKGDLASAEDLFRVPLSSDKPYFAVPRGDAHLLVLEGKTLRKVSADGRSVGAEMELPNAYDFIDERAAYYVALSNATRSLDLIDKKTLKVIRSAQIDEGARTDLALHPTRALSFVCVSKAGDGPKSAVLVVDEATGEVYDTKGREGFMGSWIRIAPDGNRAYTGYSEMFRKGSRFIVNQGNVIEIPEYGNIDILSTYTIENPLTPRPVQTKREVGGNGRRIVLSRDGKRIAYTSFTGYPLYTKNIPAWDTGDLDKRPVTYAAKPYKVEDPAKVAFHPTLPIAVIPAPLPYGVVAFQRETGQPEADRLDLRWPLPARCRVHDVVFAPDGRSVLVAVTAGDAYYLRRVPLRLSPAEESRLPKAGAIPEMKAGM